MTIQLAEPKLKRQQGHAPIAVPPTVAPSSSAGRAPHRSAAPQLSASAVDIIRWSLTRGRRARPHRESNARGRHARWHGPAWTTGDTVTGRQTHAEATILGIRLVYHGWLMATQVTPRRLPALDLTCRHRPRPRRIAFGRSRERTVTTHKEEQCALPSPGPDPDPAPARRHRYPNTVLPILALFRIGGTVPG